MKILIIDDSETVRLRISSIVESMGVTCEFAEDGLAGLNTLIEHDGEYKAVFIDLNMPNLNGLMMLEKYQQSASHYDKQKYFIVTTESSSQLSSKAKDLGIAAWVVKPFSEKSISLIMKKFVLNKD